VRGALLEELEGNGKMKRFLLTVAVAGTLTGAVHALPNPAEVIPAKGGAIQITPVYHASMQIEYKGKVFQIDPFSAGDYTGAKKADFVFITHTHADHLDPKAIAAVTGGRFVHFFVPKAVAAAMKPVKNGSVTTLNNGAVQTFNTGPDAKHQSLLFRLEAVPSYNVARGPKPGQKFHPKGQFNGYILTLGDKRIYIAGDTEATPEMKALKNIDIAFLPMNLPFTMTPQEAAAGVKAFKPKIVYPYHYRYPFTKANDNPQQFAKALEGTGIQVRLRGWYAHPAK
jgi:L-ascorbate metabolism protein UlaG (beta-lactamase superfamily)